MKLLTVNFSELSGTSKAGTLSVYDFTSPKAKFMGATDIFYMSAIIQLSDSEGEYYSGQHGIVLTSDVSKRTSDLLPETESTTPFDNDDNAVETVSDLNTITNSFSSSTVSILRAGSLFS